jgi:hypothetical protein
MGEENGIADLERMWVPNKSEGQSEGCGAEGGIVVDCQDWAGGRT